MQVAFALLHLWARVHLGRNWSSAAQIKADHRLVTTGPYRLVRHPIYTAMLGLATMAFAYRRKIRLEQARVCETFGAGWTGYRGRAGR